MLKNIKHETAVLYKAFPSEIRDSIGSSDTIKNKWLWTDNKTLESSEVFMLRAIQDYQVKLYNTGDNNLLENMKQIAEAVLKYYPEHVESLSNLSLVYSLCKEYDKALSVLYKAEEIDPKDCVVLNNIAHVCKLKGDTENSLKYYTLITKYGDYKQKEIAREQIDNIRNTK